MRIFSSVQPKSCRIVLHTGTLIPLCLIMLPSISYQYAQSIYEVVYSQSLRDVASRDKEKINFFDFLSIRPVLSIIDKKCHLLIKNRFCLELKKTNKFNSDNF